MVTPPGNDPDKGYGRKKVLLFLFAWPSVLGLSLSGLLLPLQIPSVILEQVYSGIQHGLKTQRYPRIL